MNKFFNYIKLTRINQPTGIFLLYLPCLYGMFLNFTVSQEITWENLFKISLLFFVGSVLMRSAGCIVNDLLDQKIDQKIFRTKDRPIASKKVSNFEAILILVVLLALAFFILTRFNNITILSGFFSLILVILYPLMKRIINLPQLFLGFTFNYGIIMSSLALTSKIIYPIWIFYIACILWTIIYDTIYGFQDIKDDLKVGVKSSSIVIHKKFHNNSKLILYFLTLLMMICFGLGGYFNSYSNHFFFVISVAHLFLIYKIKICDLKNPYSCFLFFKKNLIFGILILIAIVIEK